jgi:hypothetical protein
VCVRVCVCVCIRRFYCLYGDSMNVAARMSANAKESGVCVSPQIAAHLASAAASRCSASAGVCVSPQIAAHLASAAASRRSVSGGVSVPRPSSYASACLGSESVSPAARCASAAAHTADVASEELADGGSEAHASACTTPRLCVVCCVARRASDLIASHRSSHTRALSLMSRGLRLICSTLIESNRIESELSIVVY